MRVNGKTNPHGHIQLVPRGHNNEDIHIAIRVRLPVRMRAKQDDLVRLKALGNLARKAPDQPHCDIGATVPTILFACRNCCAFLRHTLILLGGEGALSTPKYFFPRFRHFF
jgi:hypothetical protein